VVLRVESLELRLGPSSKRTSKSARKYALGIERMSSNFDVYGLEEAPMVLELASISRYVPMRRVIC
jgi:hypothetical protein